MGDSIIWYYYCAVVTSVVIVVTRAGVYTNKNFYQVAGQQPTDSHICSVHACTMHVPSSVFHLAGGTLGFPPSKILKKISI